MAKAGGYEFIADQTESKDDEVLANLDHKTIERCIDAVDAHSNRMKSRGLTSWTFFGGVTNLLVVVWCVGVYPQHFWILYCAETMVLFPWRFKRLAEAKPSEVLYWMDFCWVANILCNVFMIAYVVHNILGLGVLSSIAKDHVRKDLFCAFFGVATGPLLLATCALGNALVFHSVENTVSVFIHLGPSLLMLTMRWHSEAILAAWPGVFKLDYLDSVNPWYDIFLRAQLAYAMWWGVYTTWMLSCGRRLPLAGYDTIFHCMMRSPNPVTSILGWSRDEVKRRQETCDYPAASVLLFMFLHAVSCNLAFLPAMGCFVSIYFHGSLCLSMALFAIYKGATRYNYWITENYTKVLRAELEARAGQRASVLASGAKDAGDAAESA